MPTIPTPTQNSLSVLLLPSTTEWIKPQIHYTCSVHRSKLNNNSVITGICCTDHAVHSKIDSLFNTIFFEGAEIKFIYFFSNHFDISIR